MSISNSATNQRISKVTVTSAQVKDLVANPVTLIPAAGAGNLILFNNVILTMDYNSIPYAFSGSSRFVYGSSTGSLTNDPGLEFTGKTTDIIATFATSNLPRFSADSASVYVNQSIRWASFDSDFIDGNSDINIIIYYDILSTGL